MTGSGSVLRIPALKLIYIFPLPQTPARATATRWGARVPVRWGSSWCSSRTQAKVTAATAAAVPATIRTTGPRMGGATSGTAGGPAPPPSCSDTTSWTGGLSASATHNRALSSGTRHSGAIGYTHRAHVQPTPGSSPQGTCRRSTASAGTASSFPLQSISARDPHKCL